MRIPEDYETLWFWLCLFRQLATSWIAIEGMCKLLVIEFLQNNTIKENFLI